MAKPNFIELPGVPPIPILYEDRAVLAIDKPRNWMLVPFSWQRTNRNLQAAIVSSIAAGDFWARSRGLKFLRYVHRLDAETTGILLFAKSQGAVETYSELFEDRRMEKTYLAVVYGVPKQTEWTCRLKLAQNPDRIGRMIVDAHTGKDAETHFKVLDTINRKAVASQSSPPTAGTITSRTAKAPGITTPEKIISQSLVEARPLTGRTHQIRVHLAESGCACVGDELYWRADKGVELGLRAVRLAFKDPFTRRPIDIRAPVEKFYAEYGFALPSK